MPKMGVVQLRNRRGQNFSCASCMNIFYGPFILYHLPTPTKDVLNFATRSWVHTSGFSKLTLGLYECQLQLRPLRRFPLSSHSHSWNKRQTHSYHQPYQPAGKRSGETSSNRLSKRQTTLLQRTYSMSPDYSPYSVHACSTFGTSEKQPPLYSRQ